MSLIRYSMVVVAALAVGTGVALADDQTQQSQDQQVQTQTTDQSGTSTTTAPKQVTKATKHKTATTQSDKSTQAPVDINSADAKTLTQLKGIGPKLAKKIVAYRDQQTQSNSGQPVFSSIDDLAKVFQNEKQGTRFVATLKKRNPHLIILGTVSTDGAAS